MTRNSTTSIFVFLLVQSLLTNTRKCPNRQFKIIARHHQQFDMKGIGTAESNTANRYYVAFGSDGKWVVTLVDAMTADHTYIKFKCKENYWGSVEPIVAPTKKEDALKKYHAPICCVAPYTIDAPINLKDLSADVNAEEVKEQFNPKYNPFAVLPYDHHKVISDMASPKDKGEYGMAGADAFDEAFYWYLYEAIPTSSVSKTLTKKKVEVKGYHQFKRWQIMRLDKKEWTASKEMILWKTSAVWDDSAIEKVDNCVDLEECDTGIVSDIVVFQSKCFAAEHLEHITFAFSTDGIFNLNSLLHCIPESVSYYPMSRLFEQDQQMKPSYNIRRLGSSIDLGWKLGSFCGSCPMTRMNLQISEKEALSNKQRLENALSVSNKFDNGIGVGYTRKWVNEVCTCVHLYTSSLVNAHVGSGDIDLWTSYDNRSKM